MDKKLESRQDVLDVWVEKWAVLEWFTLHNAVMSLHNWKEIWKVWVVIKEWDRYPVCPIEFDIEKILYSPSSNFFQSVFDKDVSKWIDFNIINKKRDCVISQNPLTYILDRLNDTTSF